MAISEREDMDIVIKKTRWVALFLASLMLLLSASSVLAVTSTPGFTTWPARTTTEVKKVWTIKFKSPFLSTSLNSNTIYVKDSKQAKITTTIKPASDGLSATVTPTNAYAAGDYNLYMTNGITARSGAKLGEQVILPFTVVVTPPVTPIIEVQSSYNSYVTNFTVKASPVVYKVNVNKITMQYAGDGTYTAGVFGLTKGNTITFDAYDQNGALLQTYKYQL